MIICFTFDFINFSSPLLKEFNKLFYSYILHRYYNVSSCYWYCKIKATIFCAWIWAVFDKKILQYETFLGYNNKEKYFG